MRSHWLAGQFNLRGKKSLLLSCKCCEVQDLREAQTLRESTEIELYELDLGPDHDPLKEQS